MLRSKFYKRLFILHACNDNYYKIKFFSVSPLMTLNSILKTIHGRPPSIISAFSYEEKMQYYGNMYVPIKKVKKKHIWAKFISGHNLVVFFCI